MTENLISVILPFYNSKSTLSRSVESVLAQTYKNIELIAVSDGSSDGSTELIKEYAAKDSRVRVIEAPHGGVSSARNMGLGAAKGEFIQFIDADDDMKPEMLSKMLNTLIGANADICSCAFTHPCLANYAGDRVFDFTDRKQLLEYYQHTFAGHVPWNKLYRKEVITHLFPKGVAFCEDGIFGATNMFGAKKAVTISDKLYNYYVAPKENANSCIDCLSKDKFWENGNSAWYARNALTPYVEKVFKEHLNKEECDEFLSVRAFDFLIWETVLYVCNGVPTYGIAEEVSRVIKEEAFLKAVKIKEKYGVIFINYCENEATQKAKRFVELCKKGMEETHLRPFYVCLAFFMLLFFKEEKPLNDSPDISVQFLCDKKSKELLYAKEVLSFAKRLSA